VQLNNGNLPVKLIQPENLVVKQPQRVLVMHMLKS
jgi:hypothetical protein